MSAPIADVCCSHDEDEVTCEENTTTHSTARRPTLTAQSDGIEHLLDNNKAWQQRMLKTDPEFFNRLKNQQAPQYLWIGCSDSRVPANQILGLPPGDVFVHRNIANVVIHTDLNCLSVLHYAVEVLKVRHIMVTGHYGCGGVRAALGNKALGLIDNWLRHIKDVYAKYEVAVGRLDEEQKVRVMCELNVIEQVNNVCHTTIVQKAWRRGQKLTVHGLVYDVADGLLTNLSHTIDGPEKISDLYNMASMVTNRSMAMRPSSDNMSFASSAGGATPRTPMYGQSPQ